MATQVASVSAYWIQEPLKNPYELSFGTLEAFDLIIVRAVDSDGRIGYGESCPVPPYSDETADQVWKAVSHVLPGLPGTELSAALEQLAEVAGGIESFAYVAPSTAIEALVDPPRQEVGLAVPVVGTVLTHRPEELAGEVKRLTDMGHQTLKIKVGFDPTDDAAQVEMIKSSAPSNVRLRLDANEGWDLAQASAFLAKLDPAGVELLEQPFPRDRWDWVKALTKQQHPTPLMLDESIHMEDSIERAAEAGVDIVKLKLMKVGTRAALRRRLQFAQRLGLSVVIGNGVAGVVDNWYEATCALETGRAGEMNGNLKIAHSVFDQLPHLEAGKLQFPAGFDLVAQEDELLRRSRFNCTF